MLHSSGYTKLRTATPESYADTSLFCLSPSRCNTEVGAATAMQTTCSVPPRVDSRCQGRGSNGTPVPLLTPKGYSPNLPASPSMEPAHREQGPSCKRFPCGPPATANGLSLAWLPLPPTHPCRGWDHKAQHLRCLPRLICRLPGVHQVGRPGMGAAV